MALGSAQPLTEMSTRDLSGGKKRPARKAENLAANCEPIFWRMWEPRRLTALWASTACYRDTSPKSSFSWAMQGTDRRVLSVEYTQFLSGLFMNGSRKSKRADWCSGNALQFYSGGLGIISFGTPAILTEHFRGLSQSLHKNDELVLRLAPTASFPIFPIPPFISHPIIRRYLGLRHSQHHKDPVEENKSKQLT
jgi:hypothetical protein